ncbi:atp synthase subunit epsilon [Quercus suber]|uniref:ATP synthase subunit epsilon, mitochondrial n=1 Tax=Quercus suber TaxID=58331 RepID=A0AAW0LZQ6_QUESU
MASQTAAVPFWRAAGMTYITYSNICANLVRNCLKEPHKTEALTREKVHFSLSKWTDGKPQKPKHVFQVLDYCVNRYISTLKRIKLAIIPVSLVSRNFKIKGFTILFVVGFKP